MNKTIDGKAGINGRITWLTHFACNFRCTYCFYYEGCGWEILKDRNKYFLPDAWLSAWKNFHKKYGRFVVIITGGEPFIYPNFTELIKKISDIHYPINISTNGSGDLEGFVESVDPERVTLSLSLHLQYDTIDSFLKKVGLLRKKGFRGCLNFLAYPPYLKDIKYYRERFDSIGEKLKIIPFRGIYKGNAYPWSYSRADMEAMGIEEDWLARIRRKGAYCQAGIKSVLLLPDGMVSRCGQMFYGSILGNFFDPGFRLLDDSTPCEKEICPCAEDKIFGEADIEMENSII